jgi:hypothetical protein
MAMLELCATVPCFAVPLDHRALLGGTSFLDVTASRSLDVQGLTRWFDEHVVATGCMSPVAELTEPLSGGVSLDPTRSTSTHFPRFVASARARVVMSLRSLIAAPSDDRFVRAAIYLGRVRRQGARWVARPAPTAPLSGVVLSLFAVAVLSDRDTCDQALCVCDVCGRASLDPRSEMRRSCALHADGRARHGATRVAFVRASGSGPAH